MGNAAGVNAHGYLLQPSYGVKSHFTRQKSTLLTELHGWVSDDDPMEVLDRPRVCSFLVRYGDGSELEKLRTKTRVGDGEEGEYQWI